MKKIYGIIFSILMILVLAGCKDSVSVNATFTDVDIEQTAITFTVVIDDPKDEITGAISVKLFRADKSLANSKEIVLDADLVAINFNTLDNAITYTIKVYATVEREAHVIGERTFTLATIEAIHITTPAQFLTMNTNRAGNYVLDNDIDFTDISFSSPFTASFTGSFDGQGFAIKNVKFTSVATYTGLFGYVSTGKIKNLVVDNVTIGTEAEPLVMTTSARVGILVGYVSSVAALIENITIKNSEINFTSSSTVQAYVGGIVGENKSAIKNVELDNVSIKVTATSYGKIKVGGAVGFLTEDATLKEIKSNADVTFIQAGSNIKNKDIQANIGGIVGDHNARNVNKAVENVYSTGNVSVILNFGTIQDTISGFYSVYAGGIAGIAYSNITNGFFGGNISLTHNKNAFETNTTKTFYVGGLIGFYGSNKGLANVVRISDSNTITITISDDVTLKTSQTFGQKTSTAIQLTGVYGDPHLLVNGLSMVGTDTSMMYLTLESYFTSEWMQAAYDAVYPSL